MREHSSIVSCRGLLKLSNTVTLYFVQLLIALYNLQRDNLVNISGWLSAPRPGVTPIALRQLNMTPPIMRSVPPLTRLNFQHYLTQPTISSWV